MSAILTTEPYIKYVESLFIGRVVTRIYQATKHGFAVSKFHSHCDNKGPTVTLFKTTDGNIFGGYTSVSCDTSSGYKRDT